MKKIDTVLEAMKNGKTISQALKLVMDKRCIKIFYNEKNINVNIEEVGFENRVYNALKRAHINTFNDVINYVTEGNSIKNIKGIGKNAGMSMLENILDYMWKHMTTEQRATMLLDALGEE